MSFRFLHTADIHLDSPLKSLALRDPQLADLIGTASRTSFKSIVNLCLDEHVDALVIAGDLYDGDQTSMKTARFLVEQVQKLHEAGIRVYIIRGNHDASSKITTELTFPDSVKVFDTKAESIDFPRAASEFPVVIHGLSFREPRAPDGLVRKYRPKVEGAVNIGLMHTSLGGVEGHDVYAPCSLRELAETGFHYWALGHIHKRSVDIGRTTTVMPGIPQGRDINEAGRKSVTLVTVQDDRSIHLEERFTSVAEFARVPVVLNQIADWRDAVVELQRAIQHARNSTDTHHLVSRIELVGATPLAWRLRRDMDLFKAEAEEIGARIGCCWIDKVENQTRDIITPGETPDPLIELRNLIQNRVISSPGYQQSIEEVVESVSKQLPSELRAIFGRDPESQSKLLEVLAKEGADDVLARLSGAVESGH